jgi:hypothetical protein
MSEKPVHSRLRRLVDWINLTGAKKVHSLIDKVYKRKNLEMAWEKVKANRGSGGVDGQNLEVFEAQLNQQLERLQRELKEDTYQPLRVCQVLCVNDLDLVVGLAVGLGDGVQGKGAVPLPLPISVEVECAFIA